MEMTENETVIRLTAICARRAMCGSEARKKMQQWGIDNDTADNIIDRLKNERYIDEHRYCKAFTNDKMRYNHWGEHKIAAALRAKAIPDTTIAAALNAIGNDEWKDALMPEMKKKARLLKADNHERHNRLIRFAMQRGFSYSIAEQCAASIEED